MRYRKKPVVIEARRWDPDDMKAVGSIVAWMMEGADFYINDDKGVDIVTLEGTMTASRGDWIIKGVQGEFYPCRDDIFRQTYEEAGEGGSHAL